MTAPLGFPALELAAAAALVGFCFTIGVGVGRWVLGVFE